MQLFILTHLMTALQEAAPPWVVDLVFRYGPATTLLILLIIFLYRDLWPWFRSHVDEWVSRTYKQAEEATDTLAQERGKMSDILGENTRVLQQISGSLKAMQESQANVQDVSSQILETVRQLSEEDEVKSDVEALRSELRKLRQDLRRER